VTEEAQGIRRRTGSPDIIAGGAGRIPFSGENHLQYLTLILFVVDNQDSSGFHIFLQWAPMGESSLQPAINGQRIAVKDRRLQLLTASTGRFQDD
jgi:hypothetical protein